MAKINNTKLQQQQQTHPQLTRDEDNMAKAKAITAHTKNLLSITTLKTTTRTMPTNATYKTNSSHKRQQPLSRNSMASTSAIITHSRHGDTRWHSNKARIYLKLPCLLLLLLLPLLLVITTAHASSPELGKLSQTMSGSETHTRGSIKYSQPLMTTMTANDSNDDSFRPIIPKDISPEYISRNVFTETGQYRVFEPVDSDLRVAAVLNANAQQHQVSFDNGNSRANNEQQAMLPEASMSLTSEMLTTNKTRMKTSNRNITIKPLMPLNEQQTTQKATEQGAAAIQPAAQTRQVHVRSTPSSRRPTKHPADTFNNSLGDEMKGLQELLVEYVDNFFNKGQYEPRPELVYELQKNHSLTTPTAKGLSIESRAQKKRPTRHIKAHHAKVWHGADDGSISVNIPRAVESGRLFFFSGLKKILWPIFMGLQILKSLLFAMFLPTLIGSVGKLLGKGIISGSAPLFIRPAEAPQDLDFRDNNFNFDDDNKFSMVEENKDEGYAYNQAEASQTQNQYAYNPNALTQQALSRYGNEQNKMQDSYLSALQSISSASFKNSNSISGSSSTGGLGAPLRTKPANTNTFQTFQKVPASSLLLSNYDPFYSPLLSRLDSVFGQLKLNSDKEICREKLICLMYANPAKYAPYSNLVSAQLSRELNELRKPTSDNPDILRFFKYMRAAKDGQDGVDCEKSFDRCKEFKDFENPAMVSTYHDINKLVQARKLA